MCIEYTHAGNAKWVGANARGRDEERVSADCVLQNHPGQDSHFTATGGDISLGVISGAGQTNTSTQGNAMVSRCHLSLSTCSTPATCKRLPRSYSPTILVSDSSAFSFKLEYWTQMTGSKQKQTPTLWTNRSLHFPQILTPLTMLLNLSLNIKG